MFGIASKAPGKGILLILSDLVKRIKSVAFSAPEPQLCPPDRTGAQSPLSSIPFVSVFCRWLSAVSAGGCHSPISSGFFPGLLPFFSAWFLPQVTRGDGEDRYHSHQGTGRQNEGPGELTRSSSWLESREEAQLLGARTKQALALFGRSQCLERPLGISPLVIPKLPLAAAMRRAAALASPGWSPMSPSANVGLCGSSA